MREYVRYLPKVLSSRTFEVSIFIQNLFYFSHFGRKELTVPQILAIIKLLNFRLRRRKCWKSETKRRRRAARKKLFCESSAASRPLQRALSVHSMPLTMGKLPHSISFPSRRRSEIIESFWNFKLLIPLKPPF